MGTDLPILMRLVTMERELITRQEKFKLKQEFPEGVPAWMWERGYDATKVRYLMKGRRKVLNGTIKVNDGSEHDFSGKLEDWEDRVFLNANLFTVVVGRTPFNRTRSEYKTFPEARLAAAMIPNAMIYAATETGRHVMLVPARLDHYEGLWNEKVAQKGKG